VLKVQLELRVQLEQQEPKAKLVLLEARVQRVPKDRQGRQEQLALLVPLGQPEHKAPLGQPVHRAQLGLKEQRVLKALLALRVLLVLQVHKAQPERKERQELLAQLEPLELPEPKATLAQQVPWDQPVRQAPLVPKEKTVVWETLIKPFW
jgi:hypothetical protein